MRLSFLQDWQTSPCKQEVFPLSFRTAFKRMRYRVNVPFVNAAYRGCHQTAKSGIMSEIKAHPFAEAETERLRPVYETFDKYGQRHIRTEPGNLVLPASYNKFKDTLKNWQVRDEDVYVCTFVKNGTTWTQELVWLVMNNCNFEQAKAVKLDERILYMESGVITEILRGNLPMQYHNPSQSIEQFLPSRILKSHLRFCLLPDDLLEKAKVVTCLRNPKDTLVSYYHHAKLNKAHGYIGDFATFFDLFMDNLVLWSPYFDYVGEAWERRTHPRVCTLFYEDMKKDLEGSVRKVAEFLGKDLQEGNIKELVEHLSFDSMKRNAATNKDYDKEGLLMKRNGDFMRKGEVGDWKNYFTDEMNERMNRAIEKHFKPIGLEFQYE